MLLHGGKLLLFHNHVAFELFQSLERHFQRMPVETAGLGVVVRGAGWQVAYCYGKPFKQPLSQRPHLGVEREPVQNPFPYRARLRHCHDALIKGGSATLKTYPQELPLDRKSTRLNSSHEWISYAVFCLKKKKKNGHTSKSSKTR